MATTINSENFEERVKTVKPTLVYVGAKWCEGCEKLVPMLEELILKDGSEFYGKVHLHQFEADRNVWLLAKLDVKKIPAIVIYKDGRECDRFFGADRSALHDVLVKVTA